jgi:hypothetical protein
MLKRPLIQRSLDSDAVPACRGDIKLLLCNRGCLCSTEMPQMPDVSSIGMLLHNHELRLSKQT